MTDRWFIQDIQHCLTQRNRVVIIDPKNQFEFLLPTLENKGYRILKTDDSLTEKWQTVKEELFLRYQAETEFKNEPVLFYVSREQEKLSFLFDYCFTHGCLNLKNPTEWLKMKIFQNTKLQVQMENPMLITAAKLGIGKDLKWWKNIIQAPEDIFNLNEELLPFLHEPSQYLATKDADVKRLFEEKVFELIGRPYMAKPPKILASEVVTLLFDSLLANSVNDALLRLYYRWADSDSYNTSLQAYIETYKIDTSVNVWAAHPDHCFESLDFKALKNLTENIPNKQYLSERLAKIKERVKSGKVKKYVPVWWQDVITVLEFDSKPLSACNSFEKVVSFYTEKFSKVDRAIRNLYAHFLHEEAIIRPLQEYYESLTGELLLQWFEHTGVYKTNQQGFLPQLLKKSKPRTAIIVGDGIRYEIADFVANSLEKQCKVEKQVMLADLPSETENNMSALYIGNNQIEAIHKEREKLLTEASGKNITFIDLEALNYGVNADYLVLTYKDIDSTGEKLQQGAIKLFSEFEQVLVTKINLLLKLNYSEVYLVTDHGFVLTGLLTEADKIDAAAVGKKEVHERFIRTVEKQTNHDQLSFEKPYGEFNFINVAKSHRPFKSKGVYGFSHGGFTPQEVILPNFRFYKTDAQISKMDVLISNKKDLSDVPSELFVIKFDAAKSPADLFSLQRKIQIKLYAGGIEFLCSNILNMQTGTSDKMEFSFNGNTQVQAVLVDAESKEQLDTVLITKANLRDLGGLL